MLWLVSGWFLGSCLLRVFGGSPDDRNSELPKTELPNSWLPCFTSRLLLVTGWFLVGCWLVSDWLLAGFWLGADWFVVGCWLVSGWLLAGF